MPGCKNRHSVSSGFLYSFSIYNLLQPLKALASISRLTAMEPCWWRSHAVREECGSEPLEPEITEGGSLLLVSPVLPQQEAPIQRFSIGTQPIWAANAATGLPGRWFQWTFSIMLPVGDREHLKTPCSTLLPSISTAAKWLWAELTQQIAAYKAHCTHAAP